MVVPLNHPFNRIFHYRPSTFGVSPMIMDRTGQVRNRTRVRVQARPSFTCKIRADDADFHRGKPWFSPLLCHLSHYHIVMLLF